MPGALVADAKDGKTVVLGTTGMFAVELRTSSGEELNLGNKKVFRFQFRPSAITNPLQLVCGHSMNPKADGGKKDWQTCQMAFMKAPSTISVLELDAPFPLVEVCGKVVNQDNLPIKNAWITVDAEGLYSASAKLMKRGSFCGKMPKGVKLTFSVRTGGYCTNPIFTTMVDPLSNNTQQLNPFVVTLSNQQLLVKGQVVCGNNEVAKAVVVLK